MSYRFLFIEILALPMLSHWIRKRVPRLWSFYCLPCQGSRTIAPTMFSSPFCFSIKLLVLSSIKQQLSLLPTNIIVPHNVYSLPHQLFFFFSYFIKKKKKLTFFYLISLLKTYSYCILKQYKKKKGTVNLYRQNMCILLAI